MTARARLTTVVLIAALYAGCYVAIKPGLSFAPPLRFAALRGMGAGLLLLGISAARGRSLALPRRLWLGIAGLALFGTVIGYGAMFLSLGRTGAGIASVLGNTTPLFAIGLSAVALGEPLNRAKLTAVTLGFFGVTLIAYPAITGPIRAGLLGTVLPLAAATGVATESVLYKWLRVTEERVQVAGWQLLGGGVVLAFISLSLERDIGVVWSGQFIALLSYLTIAGTALTTALWYRVLQDDEVGRLSILLFLIPVLGLGLAVILFDEVVGRIEMAGVIVTLGALLTVARDARRRGANEHQVASSAENPRIGR